MTGTCPFRDVAAGSYYEKAAIWAAENGLVSGYENGCFGPNDPVTREQLAAILYRYAQYRGLDVSQTGSIGGFADNSPCPATPERPWPGPMARVSSAAWGTTPWPPGARPPGARRQ